MSTFLPSSKPTQVLGQAGKVEAGFIYSIITSESGTVFFTGKLADP